MGLESWLVDSKLFHPLLTWNWANQIGSRRNTVGLNWFHGLAEMGGISFDSLEWSAPRAMCVFVPIKSGAHLRDFSPPCSVDTATDFPLPVRPFLNIFTVNKKLLLCGRSSSSKTVLSSFWNNSWRSSFFFFYIFSGDLQGPKKIQPASFRSGLVRFSQHGNHRRQLHSKGRPRRYGNYFNFFIAIILQVPFYVGN